MHEREYRALYVIAEEAARAQYEALMGACARAQEAFTHVRLLGALAQPGLARQRESELREAKRRLAAWAKKNGRSIERL